MTTGIVRIQSERVLLSGLWCPRCGDKVRAVHTGVPDLQDGFVAMSIEWYCKACDESGQGWIRAAYEEARIVAEDGDYTGIRSEEVKE